MSESNPYQPPSVVVEDAETQASHGSYVPEGRKVAADRGVGWLTEGFKMALAQFGPWVLITLVFGVIYFVLSMIPGIGLVMNVFMPVFIGGVLIGTRRQAEGGTIELSDLFAGFKEKFGSLVVVGVLAMVVTFALALILIAPIIGISFFTALASGNERAMLGSIGAMFLAIPLMMLIGAAVAASWWLAPALIVFHDVAPVEAMKRSFTVTMKNWAPVLIYGVLATIALMVGSIPLLLGLLVVAPGLMAATYIAYRDIFIEN